LRLLQNSSFATGAIDTIGEISRPVKDLLPPREPQPNGEAVKVPLLMAVFVCFRWSFALQNSQLRNGMEAAAWMRL
jgi:hypothetical protein